MQFLDYKKSFGEDQRLHRNAHPVVSSAEPAQRPQGIGERRLDRGPAGIWPREIKGKAEGGSAILGIQNEYLGGQN